MEILDSSCNSAELRLYIGEIVCTICRHVHTERDNVPPEAVRIDLEVPVGSAQSFADIVVDVPGITRYIVEIDYSYPPDRLLQSRNCTSAFTVGSKFSMPGHELRAAYQDILPGELGITLLGQLTSSWRAAVG